MVYIPPTHDKLSTDKSEAHQKGPKRPFSEVKKGLDEKKEKIKDPDDGAPRHPSLFDLGVLSLNTPLAMESSPAMSVSEISPLFDQLAAELAKHAMTIEIDGSDTHINATYLSEGSPFHLLEINLDHYGSAPDAFHIELLGSPEAAKNLDTHLPTLMAKLEARLPQMQIHMSPPFLKKEERVAPRVQKAKQKSVNRVSIVQETK